ncbi:MAG: glycosyltransferase [Planctomycetaceae bacterium]|jgi:glycosyltransferase involved in cell wall biosynthesis|nr:glycosyltransferase [Planctomycetaceae bacterium]
MKIGIMTFWGQINYGQNLQLFALSQFLKDAGHSPFLIRYYAADFAVNPFPPLHGKDDDKISMTFAQMAAFLIQSQNDLYARRIHSFIDTYLDVSEQIYHSAEELVSSPPAADIYITGSDQVWNFWGRPLEAVKDNELIAYFLDFGGADVQRVAYAASFGHQTLDGGYREAFAKLLQRFSYVSVREKAAVALCTQCGVAEPEWIPDPTFLLSPERYLDILRADRKFTHPEKPYILVYMVNPNQEHLNRLAALAKKQNKELKVIGGNAASVLFIPNTTLTAGIPEFVHLVANADYVFTDSFHGTVFSLIFHRQFANLPSPIGGKTDARFQSIFERFGISDRTADVVSDTEFQLPEEINYGAAGQKLNEMRSQYDTRFLHKKVLQLSPQDSAEDVQTNGCKVSVIIPVYDVGDYVRRCLDSVCGQTLQDIEIICINDASPDRSIDILREYEAKDPRVKVIDFPQNQGVAAARNAGLDAASGEFIGFVDPDDAVDLTFFESLYNKAKKTGADIAKGVRKHVDFDGNEIIDPINEKIRINKANFSAAFWSAVYSGEIIRKNHIRFPVGISIGEDLVFQARCILLSRKFTTSDFVYYYYYMRAGSAVDEFRRAEGGRGMFFFSDAKINSVLSAFGLIIRYANEAFDTGITDEATYDLLFYNQLCFTVIVVMMTDDVRKKYECAELIQKHYQLCRRKAQLDMRLEDEQSGFYSFIKDGDLKKLTAYFVEHYTLEEILRANEIRSAAYFAR